MKLYEIETTDAAISDMEGIYEYIAINLASPDTALNQYNRIAEAITSLCNFPERFPIFDIEPEKSRKIRHMTVDNYSVCYVVDEDRVVIINVLYGASDIHSKLMNRIG